MATVTFKKGDEYLAKISKLEVLAKRDVIGPAIYAAADIVADAIREELGHVPVDDSHWTSFDKKRGPQTYQLEGLARSLGISHMQEDDKGFMNVKIGFDGYNGLKSSRWPKGQPNQMVARSVDRGTSFMEANPFVKTAVAGTRKRAVETMKDKVDEGIARVMDSGPGNKT